MSEMRKLDVKVDPTDFLKFCKNEGFTVTKNGMLRMYFDRMNAQMDNVVEVGGKFNVGITNKGELMYDNMINSKVSNILADYYTHSLKRKGKRVTREKQEDKIILRVE